MLHRLSKAWRRLESVVLTGCRVRDDMIVGESAPLAASTNLVHLELGQVWDFEAPIKLLARLSPSLHTLILRDLTLIADPDAADDLRATLSPFPSAIRHFALLDDDAAQSGGEEVARGDHDELIASMVKVQKLELSPCAVTDLAASLAPLAELQELRLVQGRHRPATPVTHGELVALLKAAGSIKRLSVSAKVYKQWSKNGQDKVREAACARSVEFEVT